MAEKKIYELTDNDMKQLIKEGKARHRRCDVCGCELAVPDIGAYHREVLTTMACTVCTKAETKHIDLLKYINKLKKKHSKKEISDILDKRMDETWEEASLFTIEEWNKGIKEEVKEMK